MRQLKWVGDTAIARLEQLGYTSLAELEAAEAPDLTKQISELLGSSCWRNSPQARAAIQGILELARREEV